MKFATIAALLSATASLAVAQEEGPKTIPATAIRPAPAQAAAPARPALLAAGTLAPDFETLAPDGKTVKLSDFAGKVVVLDFWATWCPPCRAAMPHLEKVWKAVQGKDVVVLAVCVSDERAKFDEWVVKYKNDYTFPHVFDPAGRDRTKPNISRGKYNVSGIPTTYIIGKDGKVVEAVVGYRPGDTRVEAALNKAGVAIEPQLVESAPKAEKP